MSVGEKISLITVFTSTNDNILMLCQLLFFILEIIKVNNEKSHQISKKLRSELFGIKINRHHLPYARTLLSDINGTYFI